MVTLSLRKMLYCNSLKKTRNEIYDMINSLNTDCINNHSEDLIYILCGLFVYHSLGFCQNDEHLLKNNISSSYEWSEYLNTLDEDIAFFLCQSIGKTAKAIDPKQDYIKGLLLFTARKLPEFIKENDISCLSQILKQLDTLPLCIENSADFRYVQALTYLLELLIKNAIDKKNGNTEYYDFSSITKGIRKFLTQSSNKAREDDMLWYIHVAVHETLYKKIVNDNDTTNNSTEGDIFDDETIEDFVEIEYISPLQKALDYEILY